MSETVHDVYIFADYRWQLVRQFNSRQREAAIEYAEFMYREKHVLAYRVVEETREADGGQRERKIANKKKVDTLPTRPPPSRVATRSPSNDQSKARATASATGPQAEAMAEPEPLSPRGRQAVAVLLAALVIGALAILALLLKASGAAGFVSTTMLTGLAGGFSVATALGLGLLASAPDERGRILSQLFRFLSEREAAPQPAGMVPVPVPLTQPEAMPAAEPVIAEPEPEALVQLDPEDAGSLVTAERHRSLSAVMQGFVVLTRAWMAKLLGLAGAAENGQITGHMRFGLHLFLAGLCEQSGKLKQWQPHEQRFVLASSLAELFGDAGGARRFAGIIDDYLAEPRYMEMYKAGLTWDGRLDQGLPGGPALVERWISRSDGRAVEQVVVMFTDIVGSTEFTQLHGDSLQMELVQAHDRIVRQSVEDHNGRWVKHTGDGAMVAFDRALEAVRAALQIQGEVRVHNEIMPALPLKLRIGLSAGKPIKAGDDLFGSTVQLAARVCGLAIPGQITTSATVHDACANAGIVFIAMGDYTLKGFQTPQAVFAINLA
ncbi:adenylate/guanylate cyclase domain-containing protein [Ferrovibrio sp.]|uniref:adenylate/guanylate cyclase domain-containing protein n=1 Tax=Ferrovibrio sp. TaxID=1917215 RepID=UPI003D147A6D